LPSTRYVRRITNTQNYTQPQLRAIIENAASQPDKAAGTDVQRIGDFYASFMDEAKLEQLRRSA
jgi:predicted metalloendopeptidase